MRRYVVTFCFYTDRRWEETVRANGEVEALVLAICEMRKVADKPWTDYGSGFKIEITLAGE